MRYSDSNTTYRDNESNCINCQKKQKEIAELKQALTELNHECSHAYRLHEDDIVRIEQLETPLSKAWMKNENHTNQNHSR
jgi:hypothetical protein